MLAVVKKPHTEITLQGAGAEEVLRHIRTKFKVELLSSDKDDEATLRVRDSEYWQSQVSSGSLLQGYRLKHGLTQNKLGERVGMSQVMVSDYETGKRKLSMKAALKFVQGLGEKPEKFFP